MENADGAIRYCREGEISKKILTLNLVVKARSL